MTVLPNRFYATNQNTGVVYRVDKERDGYRVSWHPEWSNLRYADSHGSTHYSASNIEYLLETAWKPSGVPVFCPECGEEFDLMLTDHYLCENCASVAQR